MTSVQREFAGWAHSLSAADLDDSVVAAVKRRMLDTLAASLCNVPLPYMVALQDIYKDESGAAVVWGCRGTTSPIRAAFLNGCLAHGADFDDTQGESGVHASAVQVPVALAAAGSARAGYGEMLLALAAGLEVCVRIAGEVGHGFNQRGFHVTPVAGSFGAAVTAGRLLGLTETEMSSALGLVGSLASGLYQFTKTGGDVKRIHAGWAAHAGYQAALWAQAGLQGPDEIFEGTFGLYRTHLDRDVAPSHLCAGLGSEWRFREVLAKRYPCCHFLHATIDSVRMLKDDMAGRKVRELVALVPAHAVATVCEPREPKQACRDPYEAKFSVYYTAAAAMVEQDITLASFTPESLVRSEVRAMMPKVAYRVHDFASGAYPGGAEVHLEDGAVLRMLLETPLPLDEDSLARKFANSAAGVLAAPDTVPALIYGMEPDSEVAPLLEALWARDAPLAP